MVESQEFGALSDLKKGRTEVKRDRAPGGGDTRERVEGIEIEIADVVRLQFCVPESGVGVFGVRESEDSATNPVIVLLRRNGKATTSAQKISR